MGDLTSMSTKALLERLYHLARHIKDSGADAPELKGAAMPGTGRKWMGDYYGCAPASPLSMFFGGEPLEGSYEDLSEDIADALRMPMAGMPTYATVLATFGPPLSAEQYAIAVSWGDDGDPDEPVYWRIPYTIDADGDPVLGPPQEVTIAFVPATEPGGIGFMSHAARFLVAAREFTKRAETRRDRRVKEGRELSSGNRETLSAILSALGDVLDQLKDLHARTDPKPKDGGDGKSADVGTAESAALFLEFQRTLARLNGVGV